MPAADLTIYLAVQNGADYAEVLLRSAARHGASERYRITMSILVARSSDDTLDVCRRLAPFLPFPCRVRSVDELSDEARREIGTIVDCNDGLFNEGIWDWLVDENLERSAYYAGLHADIAFRRSGLWDDLLDRARAANADVVGVFSPGELLTDREVPFVTPPRLFPFLTLCHRERARALRVRWSRPCPTRNRRDRLIVDNGTLALNALTNDQATALGAAFLPITIADTERFIEHFGFLWTRNFQSAVHQHDGQRSQHRMREVLATYHVTVRGHEVRADVER